jgi:heme exporter protein B
LFALDPAVARGPDAAAGALWVALVFSGMLGATRVLVAEGENGCIRGLLLSPIDRATLFAAKVTAAFIFMAIALCASVVVMVLFFNLQFSGALTRLAPVLAMGALGFAALATLLAAIAGRARGGDLLLPILAVPMYVPALIAGVRASAHALGGAPLSSASEWIGILAAFDALFLTAGYLLFEHVIGEE